MCSLLFLVLPSNSEVLLSLFYDSGGSETNSLLKVIQLRNDIWDLNSSYSVSRALFLSIMAMDGHDRKGTQSTSDS